ncbi:hypothetical protein [Geodermatophilus sp. FMUSA9-8]|uniref:hypothetical protein n=1 Tax=Geodermatophilus sp. FMUSA9-8 TaxID=3120155 RepID=UPI00300A1AE6
MLKSLEQAGFKARHVATVVEPPASFSKGQWVVIGAPEEYGYLRNGIAKRVIRRAESASGRLKALDRFLVQRVLGARAYLAAGDRPEAEAMARQVDPAGFAQRRISIVEFNQVVVARVPEGGRVFGFITIIAAGLISGLLGILQVEWPVALGVLGWLLLETLVVAVSYPPSPVESRADRVGATLLAAILAAYVYMSFNSLFEDSTQAAITVAIGLAVIVLGLGALTEWRSRRLGQSLNWTLPIFLSLVGGATYAFGVLAYRLLEEQLDLPSGIVTYEAFDYILAGIPPVFLSAVALYIMI